MPITFTDSKNNISFEYFAAIPPHMDAKSKKLNIAAFSLYCLYRNAVYDSYQQKRDLANDISVFKKQYQEPDQSKLQTSPLYNDPLYHYSVAASLSAMQEWQDPDNKIQCYTAYNDCHKKIGFVHFMEKEIDNKRIIYIAQAGVLSTSRGKSVGRHLMECVLSHYPSGTEFYIVTRVFNSDARILYEKRLEFTPMAFSQVQQLGYDDRYCGFQHTTTVDEVEKINQRKLIQPSSKKEAAEEEKEVPRRSFMM